MNWIDWIRNRKSWFLAIYTLLAAAAVAGLLLVRPLIVSGSSMYPTFRHNDRVLVDTFGGDLTNLKRGDVVVFFSPEDTRRLMVKRVIGLPGDVITILEGHVFLNGTLLQEPYTNHGETSHETIPAFHVPDDCVFVLGDNRLTSSDSREWGAVPIDRIYGRIIYRFQR